jgi:hypothetical protein
MVFLIPARRIDLSTFALRMIVHLERPALLKQWPRPRRGDGAVTATATATARHLHNGSTAKRQFGSSESSLKRVTAPHFANTIPWVLPPAGAGDTPTAALSVILNLHEKTYLSAVHRSIGIITTSYWRVFLGIRLACRGRPVRGQDSDP